MSCDLQRIWTCQVCTFDNSDMHSQACGVCNNPNPLKCWACSACSFQNADMDVDECGVCSCPRIFVAKPRAQGLHSSSIHIMAIALNFSRPKTKRSKVFLSPRMHQWTLLSFVLAFLKPRLGGGASVAALAKRIALYNGSTRGFNDRILRRVFGGAGADIIARGARAELSRMLHEGPPVCEYMMELQVSRHGHALVCVGHDDVVFLQEDAQQLIDAAAGQQQAAFGEHDADEVFQIDDFELNAIVNVREATQAKDRYHTTPFLHTSSVSRVFVFSISQLPSCLCSAARAATRCITWRWQAMRLPCAFGLSLMPKSMQRYGTQRTRWLTMNSPHPTFCVLCCFAMA